MCGDQYQHTVGCRVPAALSGVGRCLYSGKLWEARSGRMPCGLIFACVCKLLPY